MSEVGDQEVPALLDTGGMGGIGLPWRLRPKVEPGLNATTGVLGHPVSEVRSRMAYVGAGASAWQDLEVAFAEGNELGSIGLDVWSAAPVCFDCADHQLI